jgi:hypothetical protein
MENKMKKTFLTSACMILFASLAVAQTTTNQPSTTRYYANRTGSITSFQPGRSITINANLLTHDTRFVVAPNVEYSTKGGGPVDPRLLRAGARVELGFNSEGQVDRVTLVDQR